MKLNSKSKPVTNIIYKQRVQSVAGTMAIEGLTLSEASRCNLDRYASGQANFPADYGRVESKVSESKIRKNHFCKKRLHPKAQPFNAYILISPYNS